MAMAFQVYSHTKQESTKIGIFRATNRRTIAHILTRSAKREDHIQEQIAERVTEVREEYNLFIKENEENLALLDEREKEIAGLKFDLHTSNITVTETERKLFAKSEKLDKIQKELIELKGKLEISEEKNVNTRQELLDITSKFEALDKIHKEKLRSYILMEIDVKKSKSVLNALQKMTQATSQEQFIEISVGDICRTIEKVQDTFHSRIQKITKTLEEKFEKMTTEFKLKTRTEYEKSCEKAIEHWRNEFTKMNDKSKEDVWSQKELYETRMKNITQKYEEEMQALQRDHEAEIRQLKEKHEQKIEMKCGDEIRFRKEQVDLHLKRQSELSTQIESLTIEMGKLEIQKRTLEIESNVTKNQPIEITLQFTDFEDSNEFVVQLELYQQCIGILERMEEDGPIKVIRKEVEKLWRKIFEWDETKDVPMEAKSLMDQIEVLSVPGSPKPPRRDDEDDEMLLEELHRKFLRPTKRWISDLPFVDTIWLIV